MRVAVIDDEPLARSGVIARLRGCAGVEIVAQYADGGSALRGLAADPPDLVFIDVDMPVMRGIDVLAALAPQQRPLAILLTAHEQFAVRAFALNALDYLLKPIDDERFAEAVARARAAHGLKPGTAPPDTAAEPATQPFLHTFMVRTGNRTVPVETRDISWIDADGDYATLHANGREYLVRESLQRLSAQLDPARFVRVHRSAIVRIDQVAELRALPNRDALLCLRDGTPIRASRTYIDALRTALERAPAQ